MSFLLRTILIINHTDSIRNILCIIIYNLVIRRFDMPDMTPVIEAKRAARKLFGGEHAKAVPIFEHCVNYDLQELARLVNMTKEIEGNIFAEDIQEKIQTFCRLRDELKPVRDQKPVYLWPEGKIPCLSDYTDNADHLYNHEPDYVPFMYEVLLAEDVTPKGAVILCPCRRIPDP